MPVSLTALPHKLHRLFSVDRRNRGSRSQPITLSRQRIYILPTRFGMLFAAMVFVLLIGSTNYNSSTGFMLTFLLAGIGLVSMLHTYRNLARLTFRAGKVSRVFCGEPASFTVYIDNLQGPARYSVALRLADHDHVLTDIPAGASTEVELAAPTERRGWLPMDALTVSARYPLGLFRAWSNIRLHLSCLVYPRPAPPSHAPLQGRERGGNKDAQAPGNDDFRGFRPYRPGDSPHHIHWKAVARGKDLLTKQFANNEREERWFDWDALAALDPEARLNVLCRWVIDAEAASHRYGLRLPGMELPISRGDAHKHHCLEALALFEDR